MHFFLLISAQTIDLSREKYKDLHIFAAVSWINTPLLNLKKQSAIQCFKSE